MHACLKDHATEPCGFVRVRTAPNCGSRAMLKIVAWVIGIIFVIGLLTVTGVLKLIF